MPSDKGWPAIVGGVVRDCSITTDNVLVQNIKLAYYLKLRRRLQNSTESSRVT